MAMGPQFLPFNSSVQKRDITTPQLPLNVRKADITWTQGGARFLWGGRRVAEFCWAPCPDCNALPAW
jgi:hypothetical protein